MGKLTGRDINALRQSLNWSQQQLAKEIKTSIRTISFWERGINNPTPIYQKRLRELMKKVENKEINTQAYNTSDDLSGEEIKVLRKSLGWTRPFFATEIGTFNQVVFNWERNKTKPLPVFQEKMKILRNRIKKVKILT